MATKTQQFLNNLLPHKSSRAHDNSSTMSGLPLQDKVILITGGSKGIGRAAAERVASEGARVVINYAGDASAAQDAVKACGGPSRAVAIQADVSKVAEIERLVAGAVEAFGHIDVLVANAGVMPMRSVEDTTEEDFDSTFAINVKGPYFLVQKALPHMPSGGRVVFLSSSVATFSSVQPSYLLYSATKGAVEQMTRLMAKDLAKKGINVNCVAPGPTATELFFKGKPEAAVNAMKSANPFNRLGEPDEIAAVVSFLSGEDSRWIAGQTIKVNGAMTV